MAGNTCPYEPPPDGGQPLTQKVSLEYEQTHEEGSTATTELAVGYSLSVSADLTIPVANWLSINFNASVGNTHELTMKNSVSVTATQTNTQTAALSLTGPSAEYTGPTPASVFKDNVYGTFMFAFPPGVQGPEFVACLQPVVRRR